MYFIIGKGGVVRREFESYQEKKLLRRKKGTVRKKKRGGGTDLKLSFIKDKKAFRSSRKKNLKGRISIRKGRKYPEKTRESHCVRRKGASTIGGKGKRGR